MNFQNLMELKASIKDVFKDVISRNELTDINIVMAEILEKFIPFEAQFHFDKDFEKSKDMFIIETKNEITNIDEGKKVIADIINNQIQVPLRFDAIIDEFYRLERNFNQTPLYKLELKDGKARQRKTGDTLSFGQHLLNGMYKFNKDKTNGDTWYLKHFYPQCSQKRTNALNLLGRKIRRQSTMDKSYHTKLRINYLKKEILLLVKTKGTKCTKWVPLEKSDMDQNIKNEYINILNIPFQFDVQHRRNMFQKSPKVLSEDFQTIQLNSRRNPASTDIEVGELKSNRHFVSKRPRKNKPTVARRPPTFKDNETRKTTHNMGDVTKRSTSNIDDDARESTSNIDDDARESTSNIDDEVRRSTFNIDDTTESNSKSWSRIHLRSVIFRLLHVRKK